MLRAMNKPYAESCDQNCQPILALLRELFPQPASILEIGSGTGQHAVYFAKHLPWLKWQSSDLAENHTGINAWLQDSGLDNVYPPLQLDCRADRWAADLTSPFDHVFSANSLHIMDNAGVEGLFSGLADVLHQNGLFAAYGPFNYAGAYSSDSNRQFDAWLKARDPASGIKDIDWLNDLAKQAGMLLQADHEMPANNRILVWRKQSA